MHVNVAYSIDKFEFREHHSTFDPDRPQGIIRLSEAPRKLLNYFSKQTDQLGKVESCPRSLSIVTSFGNNEVS